MPEGLFGGDGCLEKTGDPRSPLRPADGRGVAVTPRISIPRPRAPMIPTPLSTKASC